jgi:hypothetical protein
LRGVAQSVTLAASSEWMTIPLVTGATGLIAGIRREGKVVETTVLIAAGTALFVAAVWVLVDFVQARRRRKSRARELHQVAFSEPMQLSLPQSEAQGIRQERSELIRIEAENAARMAFIFPDQKMVNPYPEGTPEFVLWTTSYHLVHMELSEARDAAGQAPEASARESRPSRDD